MNRLNEMLRQIISGVSNAVWRFPLTAFCLAAAATLICYMISWHQTLVLEKLMYTFLVGAILGMAAQFATERFDRLARVRLSVYGLAAVLTAGYFLILYPAPQISAEITVRTLVTVFALICAVLWVPAYKRAADFNAIALIHFKSFFTSVLYAGVLSAGLAAIIATVDVLLFNVHYDAYSYMLTIVWVLFAPVYYLSLLPVFNAHSEEEAAALHDSANYPKFLQILVSHIAIPLVAVYTVVLLAYFIKILVTMHWPSGQLGPMILVYSAAGLVIFVLASLLDNRFAQLYRRIFPKVLVPIVIMQMISVWIRLNAYGVTESRYYVVLFGLFSIAMGIVLSFKPVVKNSYIALLAAALAIVSIIPPVDAFTVSRNSQINRVENILQAEGMLVDGKITAKANASEEARYEVTNILTYLNRSSSLRYIAWLPQDFMIYEDMKETFGFGPYYGHIDGEQRYFYASLDQQKPLPVSGYDISVQIAYSSYDNRAAESHRFNIGGRDYELKTQRVSAEDTRVIVTDSTGRELIATNLYAFVKNLADTVGSDESKTSLPPEQLTLELAQGGYRLKVVFQNINITFAPDTSLNCSATVFFGVNP